MSFIRNLDMELREAENDDFDSSGCELSFEMPGENQSMQSPCVSRLSRKLNFTDTPCVAAKTPPSKAESYSPPYKRVRALRLFDSPLTPKTILEKSSIATRLFSNDRPTKAVATAYPSVSRPAANVNPFTPNGMLALNSHRRVTDKHFDLFTGILLNKKRTRSIRSLLESPDLSMSKDDANDSDGSDDMVIEQPTKRLALRVRILH